MKVLVTGGLGFIGHYVVQELERLGVSVAVIDNKSFSKLTFTSYERATKMYAKRESKLSSQQIHDIDICELYRITWIFERFNPDVVIHLASPANQAAAAHAPQLSSRTMSEGLLNILQNCHTNQVKKFVYISSSMVYGNFNVHNGVMESAQCKPIGLYGILKLAGEEIVKNAVKNKYLTNYTIIRPSAVYGPDDCDIRVIRHFLGRAMDDGILTVNGLNQRVDFSYVTDVAYGIVQAALSSNTSNKTYNLTRGSSRTLLQAAQTVVNLVGKGRIEIKNDDPGYPTRGTLNIDAAKRDFNYDPKIDIEEGIALYYRSLQVENGSN